MSSPESISDPLFWPWFLFAAVMVVVVLAFTWVVHRITTPRPELPPRDLRQDGGDRAKNVYDASSHSKPRTRIENSGTINVNVARPRPKVLKQKELPEEAEDEE